MDDERFTCSEARLMEIILIEILTENGGTMEQEDLATEALARFGHEQVLRELERKGIIERQIINGLPMVRRK